MTWPIVQLGEVCEFKYGKALAAGQRDGGEFPVYGSNGIVGWHSKAITDGPTIVVGRKGSFGEVAYSPKPCWPIDTTYYIDSSITKVDLKWLSYRLAGLELTELNRAAAVPGLNREDAYRQQLKLPPPDEQRRIAAILDQADALSVKRRQVNQRTDELIRAVFNAMFGNLPAEHKLADGCIRITDGTHQSPQWSSSGVPFLFISNITSGQIDFNTSKYISIETWRDLTRSTPIEVGDVLYSTVGVTYGIPAIVRSTQRFAFQRHIAHLKPRPDVLLPEFLAAMLASPLVKRQADRAARGAAQPTVNLADIKKFDVILPRLEEQKAFAACMESVRSMRSTAAAGTEEHRRLFISLQSRAFSGQL